MKKLLIVVDMQKDFVTGTLGSPQAERIVPAVKAKVGEYKRRGDRVIFTRDTHTENYLDTQEGRRLPVIHCVAGTEGHEIIDELDTEGCEIFDKPTFGSLELAGFVAAENEAEAAKENVKEGFCEIELCGLCTDICVVSNALILKARLPETKISVDPACCAGVSEEGHEAALLTMRTCQVDIRNENLPG